MKYRNFRNIVALVAFAALGGTCYGCYGCWQHKIAQEESERRARDAQFEREKLAAEERARRDAAEAAAAADRARSAAAADLAVRTQTPGAYWGKASFLRAVDKDLIALLDRPVTEKIKDGSKGKPYKINLYSDNNLRWTRAKVDLDRDNKADESWVIKDDGFLERKVSANDDEVYNQTFRLDMNSGWVPLDAARPTPPATSPATSTTAPAGGLRDVDTDMLTLVKGPAQEKVKDATKGKSYKINLYSDDGQKFNRAKVDLNRNDKWDESWTFKADGTVERQVAPADDEKYSEVWLLSGGTTWKKK